MRATVSPVLVDCKPRTARRVEALTADLVPAR
jgi:hypothetical protein